MNAEEYFIQLIAAFPNLEERLSRWESDMIFFKMETFAEYTIEQIERENTFEIIKCFQFQESKIDLLDSLLLNALTVSYCEALLLSGVEQKMKMVYKLMGPRLEKLYREYKSYYSSLGGSHRTVF